MSSRRIPISNQNPRPSNARPVAGAPNGPGVAAAGAGGGGGGAAATTQNNNPAWQSSLDIVFSFSRSQAFFGSNLPTSPSFVQRYRRPNFRDDDLESSTTAPSDREAERTTSDDGGREEDGSDEEGWSEDEIDARAISWDSDGVAQPSSNQSARLREQLPRNAVERKASTRSKTLTAATDSGAALAPPPAPRRHSSNSSLKAASERTPLISPTAISERRQSAISNNQPNYSPPDSVPFPRRSPSVSAALLSQHNERYAGSSARRLSIISSEGWKEAVNENRGMSTFGQTLFNAVNVLVGVGLLAEPLAFADAGWVLGTLLLLFCALVTNYTAKMLARLMSQDNSLRTYTDVLIKAFGQKAQPLVHGLFVFELSALSIALVILFSDSMSTLFPGYSSNVFKILGFFLILPTTFIPLRFLSITSIIGIISSFMLLFVLIADGSIKRYPPGSLWVPAETFVGPRWMRLPLSFGLFMSGFAGHAVIPSLYRDMKDPHLFERMINVAYVFAFAMSMVMGALGYVMFGNSVTDEVTRNLRQTHGYPQALNKVAVWMIAINPVVKYSLASGPLTGTIEFMLGFHPATPPSPDDPIGSHVSSRISSRLPNESAIDSGDDSEFSSLPPPPPAPLPAPTWGAYIRQFAMRPILLGAVTTMAILVPNFGIVLALLGSSSAFAICAIGPIGAYLILGRRDAKAGNKIRMPSPPGGQSWKGTGPKERVLCYGLLVISVLFAVVGSVWVFLPVHGEKHR